MMCGHTRWSRRRGCWHGPYYYQTSPAPRSSSYINQPAPSPDYNQIPGSPRAPSENQSHLARQPSLVGKQTFNSVPSSLYELPTTAPTRAPSRTTSLYGAAPPLRHDWEMPVPTIPELPDSSVVAALAAPNHSKGVASADPIMELDGRQIYPYPAGMVELPGSEPMPPQQSRPPLLTRSVSSASTWSRSPIVHTPNDRRGSWMGPQSTSKTEPPLMTPALPPKASRYDVRIFCQRKVNHTHERLFEIPRDVAEFRRAKLSLLPVAAGRHRHFSLDVAFGELDRDLASLLEKHFLVTGDTMNTAYEVSSERADRPIRQVWPLTVAYSGTESRLFLEFRSLADCESWLGAFWIVTATYRASPGATFDSDYSTMKRFVQ
ncbi:hypothetical protein BDY21DRAFT_96233 [Lineolata rhizophorae]|uniref:PH domain-containing protein n=1 Tax=Lineolata rhizophorae TaxID=578093 RepID=A0A6A6NTX6_9PEZI|nr:hypothetical protein BDY21DRAFT_96233 [Lineolata rhizophorae]